RRRGDRDDVSGERAPEGEGGREGSADAGRGRRLRDRSGRAGRRAGASIGPVRRTQRDRGGEPPPPDRTRSRRWPTRPIRTLSVRGGVRLAGRTASERRRLM